MAPRCTSRGRACARRIDATAGAAHDTLSVTLYVLAFPATDCGDGDTEQIALQF